MEFQQNHLNQKVFQQRRKDFLERLPEGSVAIVPSSVELIRNHDVIHVFRQDSNFFYLTGFHEPDSWAILKKSQGDTQYFLFVRPRDESQEIWTGRRVGAVGAVKDYLADEAFNHDELPKKFIEILSDVTQVYYRVSDHRDDLVMNLLMDFKKSQGRTGQGFQSIVDPSEILGEMRIKKRQEEISLMRTSCEISSYLHNEVIARVRPGLNEMQIEGFFEGGYRSLGCARHGYPSIVASGENATVLHYHENARTLQSGDLLLLDAGGEYEYYSADITRTYPVNGKFTLEQKLIYEAVLDVQKICLSMVKPGMTMTEIHKTAVFELTQRLIDLGLLKGSASENIESLAYRRFYPHGTGHFLGMDVHDAGLYIKDHKPRPLEPGMVFTVEPGIYIQPYDQVAPEKFRGIGVRIEDNVLVTEKGCEVLTKNAIKEVSDLEGLIGSQPWPKI